MDPRIARPLATLTLLALVRVAGADTPAPAGIPNLSSERLARIGATVRQYVANGRVAGILTQATRGGRIVPLEAFGDADLHPKLRALVYQAIVGPAL